MIFWILLAVVEVFLLIGIVHSEGHLIAENIHGSEISLQMTLARQLIHERPTSLRRMMAPCDEGVESCHGPTLAQTCKAGYHLSSLPSISLSFHTSCIPCSKNEFTLRHNTDLSCQSCSSTNIPCLPNGLPSKGCPAGYFGNSIDKNCTVCGMGEFSSDMQGLGLGGKRNFGSECSGKCSDGGFATCEADSGRGISCLGGTVFNNQTTTNANSQNRQCSILCEAGTWAYVGNKLTSCIPCHQSNKCDAFTGTPCDDCPEADTWPDITGTCIAKANPKKLAGCLALSDLS